MTTFVEEMLKEFNHAGVTVTIDPQCPDQLFIEGPCNVLTPKQVETLRTHKPHVLKVLRSRLCVDSPAPESTSRSEVTYTDVEQKILEETTPEIRETVDRVKRLFACEGEGPTLLDIKPDPDAPRRRLKQLIQLAESAGDKGLAIQIQDTWDERMAICMVDGGMSPEEAEALALEEVEKLLNQ